jgi:TrmH family RNA methyltransferase
MLSRSQQKLLRKLSSKKYRQQYGLFVAEGRKVVAELLAESLKPEWLAAIPQSEFAKQAIEVTEQELKELTNLEKADEVIGVFALPQVQVKDSKLKVVLDGIKDPGNLGTIIRTCDWFGVQEVYCTIGTTDIYNPKTVQSTMGSIARVRVNYLSNEDIFRVLNNDEAELICADMEGTQLKDFSTNRNVALVMGSESHGPSAYWKERCTGVTIPRKGNSKTESLNVGVAAGIFLEALS